MFKFSIYFSLLAVVWSACDVCHTGNPVACHDERKYSLCMNGSPSHDYIYCPVDYVCTAEKFICIPKSRRIPPSCPKISRCGVCSTKKRIFSCLNETTIAFCFGNDKPNLEALAYCPGNTICDIDNEKDFCSYENQAEASCKENFISIEPSTTTEEPTTTTTDKPTTTTTEEPTTTTTEKPATTTTEEPTTTKTTMAEPTTTTTTEKPTTKTTTTEEPTTTKTTMVEPTTATTTAEPTTITTTTTKSTTTSTEKSTTTTTTTTRKPSSTTPQVPRDPLTFCREKKKSGSFKPDGDTECRRYIYCTEKTLTTGIKVWDGGFRNCPSRTWFNGATCVETKPANCD